jgi:hypothetical protein
MSRSELGSHTLSMSGRFLPLARLQEYGSVGLSQPLANSGRYGIGRLAQEEMPG